MNLPLIRISYESLFSFLLISLISDSLLCCLLELSMFLSSPEVHNPFGPKSKRQRCLSLPLAEPELQKRVGQICAEIFERRFFRRFPTQFLHFPSKIPSISQNFLMTFFSHRPFRVLVWYF